MEPDEASVARREIGHEAPPPVVFYEMFVSLQRSSRQFADELTQSHIAPLTDKRMQMGDIFHADLIGDLLCTHPVFAQ